MNKYLSVLKQCPLFSNIEDNNIIPLLKCINARKQDYKKGDIIFSQGDTISVIGIVLEGEIQFLRYDYNGNRSIVANIYETQIFGEAFACADVKNIPIDVVANEDTTLLLVDISRIIKTCNNACVFHNNMIYNLLKSVSTKTILLNKKIEIISKRSTRENLLTYLYIRSSEVNSDKFTIPYNRQELADYLEVERSGLSMEISKLCKEGIMKNVKNYFELK